MALAEAGAAAFAALAAAFASELAVFAAVFASAEAALASAAEALASAAAFVGLLQAATERAATAAPATSSERRTCEVMVSGFLEGECLEAPCCEVFEVALEQAPTMRRTRQ